MKEWQAERVAVDDRGHTNKPDETRLAESSRFDSSSNERQFYSKIGYFWLHVILLAVGKFSMYYIMRICAPL